MTEARIGKNHVEIFVDGSYVADVWGEKVEIQPHSPGNPFLVVNNPSSGWLSFIHPDQIAFIDADR